MANKSGAKRPRKSTKPPRATSTMLPPPPIRRARSPVLAPPLFVVGVGASAGGLEALEALFDGLTENAGMAFVVVTHQHPQHPSLLPELLAKHTHMPVVRAQDGQKLESNHVYVSTPGTNLTIEQRTLRAMPILSGLHRHLPIDHFFRSLARDQGEQAICIVLSGTGTDGTLGLREIKGSAGMAIVQDENSAQYGGMPHSAAATQLADYLLRPDQMAAQLMAYGDALRQFGPVASSVGVALENALGTIFALLRKHVGHDFSGYKLSAVRRRIERRMRVHQLTHAAEYVQLLESTPHELELLFQDLLITVTQFFRDPDAYEAVKHQLSQYIEQQPEPVSLRIWAAGCSTGEEAYSLAMLALELAEQLGKDVRLQVFATDLDARAIELARTGLYAEGIAVDVSPERLERFFQAETRGHRVSKQLRDCIVFAPQNVLHDPPFTKLDLMVCRNLLIYLNPELQETLLRLFHYALKPGGALWLGASETAVGHTDLFSTIDRTWRVYRRRDGGSGLDAPAIVRAKRGVRSSPPPMAATIGRALEELLIRRYAPPTVIVTGRGELAYVHGRTGAFLEPSPGEPRHSLFAMAREDLRLPLRAALREASRVDREVILRDIPLRGDGLNERVHIVARRIGEPESLRGLFCVSFIRAKLPANEQTGAGLHQRTRQRKAFDRELAQLRESLRATLDELQASNESLTSTNEEMQSTNEQLQSTNDAMEASHEELQSLNEELTTINSELHEKVDELAQVNDDMQNLLNGTDIATLFLDRELRIKRFTEQARRVVRLIASDVGRPLGDLVPQVRYDNLTQDAQRVLDTLVPQETEAQTLDGKWLLVRVLPYRTAQNVIGGVVVMFLDIDRVKRAELVAAESVIASRIVQSAREPLVVLDAQLCIASANRAFSRLFGPDWDGTLGRSFLELVSGAPALREALAAVLRNGEPIEAVELTYRQLRLQLNARRLEESGEGAACVLIGLVARAD